MYVLGVYTSHLYIYTCNRLCNLISNICTCNRVTNYMYIYTIHVMIDTCVSKKFFSHNIPIQ